MATVIKPPKQPWEIFPIQMGFSANMEESETIDALKSSVTVIDVSSGVDVSLSLLSGNPSVVDRQKIMVTLKGGVKGKKYKVSFRAWISENKNLEEDLILDVID